MCIEVINLEKKMSKQTIAIFALILSAAIIGPAPAYAADSKDDFIECLMEGSVPVAIYLVNGIKLQGQIVDWTDEVIFLANSVDQMVYIHSISTIVPSIGTCALP